MSTADCDGALESEPVSVHPPYTTHPGDQPRYEPRRERHAALQQALTGVVLGAHDQWFLDWLSVWDVTIVASAISPAQQG